MSRTGADLGVVLSGGGINGVLLELGFLKRLRKTPLWERVGWIYGTSSGALAGAMATLDRLDELESFLLGLRADAVLEERLALERDESVVELQRLRTEIVRAAVVAAPRWRRRRLRSELEQRFAEASFPSGTTDTFRGSSSVPAPETTSSIRPSVRRRTGPRSANGGSSSAGTG